MKKILAFVSAAGAATTTSQVYAQSSAASVIPTCALAPKDLANAPSGDDLLAQQDNLTTQKRELILRLNDLSAGDAAGKKGLEDKIELNRIALSHVQKALAFYVKRQDNVAECESALKRWAFVGRIMARQEDASDRQVVVKVETDTITEKLNAAKKANDDLIAAGPSAKSYTRLSLGGARIAPEPGQAPRRQADAGAGNGTPRSDPCARMIELPEATLRVGDCGGQARMRSVRSYAGGDVAFPSSVLTPRGIAANLAGSTSDGTVSITYADSFKSRRTPKRLPENPNQRVQLPLELGYSFSVKAKDGLIFARDDIDKSIKDNIDGKAIVSAGLFFSVYEGETLEKWNDRAIKLRDAAIKACRKEQAGGESKTPSTCIGQSLTDWVFDVDEKGTLLHPELAKQASDLYFRSKDDKPVWGGGINFSTSHGNYDYLDPAIFVADPTSKNQSAGDWNFATTVFAYRRLNPTSSKMDVSVIPSLSYSSNFGYIDGTKPKQFCPAATTGTPYVTGGCPSYYVEAPTRIRSWTPAAELRILTPRLGGLPSLGISPKLSYNAVQGSSVDRWRLELPVVAFVEKEAGLGVGLQYSRKWGGHSDTANADGNYDKIPADDTLKIVVTKTFSLTGY